MAHDQKLVETVAAKLMPFLYGSDMGQSDSLILVEVALAAIDASGTHWVAPWGSPLGGEWIGATDDCWATLRDAYLAGRRGDAG